MKIKKNPYNANYYRIKDIEKIEERKRKLIQEYLELCKIVGRRKMISKKDALARTYEAKGQLKGKRVGVRINLPLALAGCSFKLVETTHYNTGEKDGEN